MTRRTPPEPERRAVYVSGRRLSFLDFGGPGRPLPALLVRGSRSTVLSAEHARSMAARRPRTRLVELPAGHSVHETVPVEFAGVVRGFLGSL